MPKAPAICESVVAGEEFLDSEYPNSMFEVFRSTLVFDSVAQHRGYQRADTVTWNLSSNFAALTFGSLTPARAAQCAVEATATSNTDASKSVTSPTITIYPNVSVSLGTAPSSLNEGVTKSGAVTWSLASSFEGHSKLAKASAADTSASCGTLLAATGSSVIYTAGPSVSGPCTVAPESTLTVTTSYIQIPQGMVGMPYTQNSNNTNCGSSSSCSTISGGTSPYTLSYSGLPSWASYDQSSNIYSTPTGSATVTKATLTVTDSAKNTKTGSITIPVIAATGTTNNSLLTGQYACVIHRVVDGGYSNSLCGGQGFLLSMNRR